MMKREDWRRAYEPLPTALESRVAYTLSHLEDKKPVRRLTLRTAVLALALLLALAGAAYAVIGSLAANTFGLFYGGTWQQDLQDGNAAPVGQSYRLGDVTYTLEDMVYKQSGRCPGLYGVVRIAPAEGANIVLMPNDLDVFAPTGDLLSEPDEDAPSYAELAAERGARILAVRAAVNSISADGEPYNSDFGEALLPQEDGSILGTLEMPNIASADSYELNLYIANWEAALDGTWPEGTRLKYEWIVTFSPEHQTE